MDSFGAVRALAREKHALMRVRASMASTAMALLTEARAVTNAFVQAVPADHPLLASGDGALHRNAATPSIYICDALSPEQAAYVEAHEFGHFWIETPIDPAIVPRGSDPGTPEENTPTGVRRVEAYSPQELRERHANVFAREFLLPTPEARRLFELGHTASQIATAIGVPLGLVYQQLAIALLLPESPAGTQGVSPKAIPALDPSQKLAAEHHGSPLLVEAGPGTGKTRSLVARIEHLLGKGVAPAGILVLTFSNKAAREIRERVAASAPAASAEIWAGTFHAFGLELLRKFGHLEMITQPVQLLDQADQLAFLERELPQLGIDHYLRLSEPLFDLRHILGAISRAKDELVSPQTYADKAAQMRAAAGTDEQKVLRAEKALEVAHAYRHYDLKLRQDGVVDFADLINRSIEILRRHPDVRAELAGQYLHILVDEYQDVNRASAVLLKELAGDGANLWVVGDARQSIYRFRGAAPVNTTKFERDYPKGQRKSLAVNYRSRKQIVDAFGAYANGMKVGRERDNRLEARRGPSEGAIDFNVAVGRASEIAGIAAQIARYREAGYPLSQQAILCRGHSNLQRIALGLEAAGIAVLYLGDLFERPEVRDLLSLLSFVAEPHRGGLMRVATLPRYRMPLADVRAFLAGATTIGRAPKEALGHVDKIEGLSEPGRTALRLLHADVGAVQFMTGPGAMLCRLLFECGLARDVLPGSTPADLQRRLAIHQFLQFAIENDIPGEGDPKRRLLRWIRRLATFGDDRSLREPPAAVEHIDAVRLMTVHMSKGLEFDIVHLPVLGKGIFPLSWSGQVCPAPEGMLETRAEDDQAEEEECLFFVAVSRAREHLSLSRAERYSDSRRSTPSPALIAVGSHLPRPADARPTWNDVLPVTPVDGIRPDLKIDVTNHDARDIELYLDCPRRFLYQFALGLSATREDNGYVRFHQTVYRVLRWLQQQEGPVDAAAIKAEFDARWAETGPLDHPLEPLYRASAEKMLGQESRRPRAKARLSETLSANIAGATIRVPVDEIEEGQGGLVVRRLRTGRPPSRPDQSVLHVLMAEAARQTLGSVEAFEIRYLSADKAVAITLDGVRADRLEKCTAALAGMAAGEFPAKPSDDCPRCPYFFICASAPD